METEPKIPEEIPDKYIEWIRTISMWDPKEMRRYIAENIKIILDKFAGELFFLAKGAKDTSSKDLLTTRTVVDIMKEFTNYLPPMEMN